MHRNHILSNSGDDRGQALVEFALVAPILLLLLYAIIQFGLLLYGFISVEQAARNGVRVASLGESATAVGTAIDANISGLGMSPSAQATASYTPPSPFDSTQYRLAWEAYYAGSGSASTITVGVYYRYPVLFPFVGIKDFEMQQTLTMPEEDAPGSGLTSASATEPYLQEGPTN